MLILHDPETLLHSSLEILGAKLIPALESPARLKSILEAVAQSKHEIREINCPANTDLLKLTGNSHEVGYLEHLKNIHNEWVKAGLIDANGCILPECFRLSTSSNTTPTPPKDKFARIGYYAFDMSTGLSADSFKSIVASANLASQGAKLLSKNGSHISSSHNTIFALCRPPGHHCDGTQAGGYCYVNNAAVAIHTWRSLQQSSTSSDAKIGILDLDFHHGNGTQEIFYKDPNVMYVSIHGEDEFPYYTGNESEQGVEAGKGTNVNLPLKSQSSLKQYLAKLDIGLNKLDKFQPQFLVISLGFDTFHLDPLGAFKIDTDDYETISYTTRKKLNDIPALILLEGGYVIEHLGANVISFLKGWERA